jgi:hypothetical protein
MRIRGEVSKDVETEPERGDGDLVPVGQEGAGRGGDRLRQSGLDIQSERFAVASWEDAAARAGVELRRELDGFLAGGQPDGHGDATLGRVVPV